MPHELRTGGAVMSDDDVKVTATVVDHPPVVPAFAYRFDARDRSVVISGDTAPSENLVKLAHGADVLVHSVMYPPVIDRLVSRVPNAAALKASILAHQTSAEDAGRIAKEAKVGTLVLSHFVPPDDPLVTDETWLDAARTHFRGKVVVGKDLLEVRGGPIGVPRGQTRLLLKEIEEIKEDEGGSFRLPSRKAGPRRRRG